MADYYPLLARALSALPDRSPALRKAVYDRARSALLAQLRSLDPPISESDIDLERQALDQAIARLEAEHADPPAVEPAAMSPSVQETNPVAEPAPVAPVSVAPASVAPIPAERQTEPTLPSAPKPELVPPPAANAPEALPEPGPPPFVAFTPPRSARAEPAPVEADPPPPDGEPLPAEAGSGRQRPKLDVVAPKGSRSRTLRNVAIVGMLALVIGIIAVAAFLLRDKPAELQRSTADAQGLPSASTPEAKLSDRVGGDAAARVAGTPPAQRPSTTAQPTTPPVAQAAPPEVTVAQRALLIEENVAEPNGPPVTTQGRVSWRLETVNGDPGQPLQTVVRASVDYPDKAFSLTMTLRRNTDPTLPASHTIELVFQATGPEAAKRGVETIGLLQLKDDESGRGSPVSGLPVRVRENLFLIGLSSLKSDVERNTDMLVHKSWLDLVVKFAAGPRAILSFEKGSPGQQALQAAFEQWDSN